MKQPYRNKNWDRTKKGKILEMQNKLLRNHIRDQIFPFSKYYQKLFKENGLNADSIQSVSDLQKLPFTSKKDLLNTPEAPQRVKEFLLIPDEKILSRRSSTIFRALISGKEKLEKDFGKEYRPVLITFTTGRSADPVLFFYSGYDLENFYLSGERVYQLLRSSPDDRILNMFPYAPHLAFWQAHYSSKAQNVFNFDSGGGKVMGTEGNIRFLEKFKPTIIVGMPTFIYHVLSQAAEEKLECPTLKKIVLGGEKVPDGMRRKLRQLASQLGSHNAQVIGTYGFTEAKMSWTECLAPEGKQPSGYHLYPDLGIFEVVDPLTGKMLPDDTPGELVYTPINCRGSAVVRYRTGDYTDGGLTYEPCPHCRRTMPRITGKISRKSNMMEMNLDKIKGTLVDFNQLENVFDDIDCLGAWQMELRRKNNDPFELDELVVHVTKNGNISDDELKTRLIQRLVSVTELSPNLIQFHSAAEMRVLQGVGTELKEKRVVDRRPKESNGSLVAR
jgi:phenylacetate-CoA ligase